MGAKKILPKHNRSNPKRRPRKAASSKRAKAKSKPKPRRSRPGKPAKQAKAPGSRSRPAARKDSRSGPKRDSRGRYAKSEVSIQVSKEQRRRSAKSDIRSAGKGQSKTKAQAKAPSKPAKATTRRNAGKGQVKAKARTEAKLALAEYQEALESGLSPEEAREEVRAAESEARRQTKPTKPGKPKAKRKARKPKRPSTKETEALFWQGYFHDALIAIKEQLQRTTGIVLPVHLKTWKSQERADAVLTVDISQAPDAAHAIQKALGDSAIDYLTQGGFFISFAYSGRPGKKDSPTLSKSGGTAETWPTQDLGAAIDTAEGTRNISGVLRNVEAHLDISQIKVRLHWNPFGEQPERMG